jgi:hypothetical protein
LRQTLLTEGVAPLTAAALNGLKIREYNFLGTEVDRSPDVH